MTQPIKLKKLKILVLDDDPVYRTLLRSILSIKTDAFVVESPSLAFKVLLNEAIDILICDFHLPEMNGLEVITKVKAEYPSTEIIMISSTDDINTVIQALRSGAVDFFRKPFASDDIWLAIERTRKFAELNEKLNDVSKKNSLLSKTLKNELGNLIIGDSLAIQKVKQQIQLVSSTPDTSVLIIGESGTGKELVARGIHDLSSRKDELLGAVNMSAVPESLFESEFFGHKKGSFTGAIGDKAGWFETCHKGTLFFDEVGEMSMPLQVKLLRVLEDRKFVKVGSQQEQQFDIRIISATNKTEEELSGNKIFRLDLFHRLSTFVIYLPPLRERKQDILQLANYFIQSIALKMGKKNIEVSKETEQLLLEYDYPGNIRELRNIIERAIILCTGHELLPEHLYSIKAKNGATPIVHTKNVAIITENEIYDLEIIEKITIEKVLHKVAYNKSEAAKLLNLEWNALHRRIKKHNIMFPEDNY